MDRAKKIRDEERRKKAREYYQKNKNNPKSSIYKRTQAKKEAVKTSKGKYGHRALEELKGFVRRYNKHFQIKTTGKSRKQLEEAIDEGMKKSVDGDLREAHKRLLAPKQSLTTSLKDLKFKKKDEKPKITSKAVESGKTPSKSSALPARKNRKPAKSTPVASGKTPSKSDPLPPRKSGKSASKPKKKVEAIKVVSGKKKTINLKPVDLNLNY